MHRNSISAFCLHIILTLLYSKTDWAMVVLSCRHHLSTNTKNTFFPKQSTWKLCSTRNDSHGWKSPIDSQRYCQSNHEVQCAWYRSCHPRPVLSGEVEVHHVRRQLSIVHSAVMCLQRFDWLSLWCRLICSIRQNRRILCLCWFRRLISS